MELQLEPNDERPLFPLFSSLPPEIRLQIWAYAAQEPRMVLFEISRSGARHLQPPILHTCHESRVEGLKAYEILRNPACPPNVRDPIGRRAKLIYFNIGCDTLLIDSLPRNYGWARKLGRSGGDAVTIERLAMTRRLWSYTSRWAIWRDLTLLKGPKELILIADDWELGTEYNLQIEFVDEQETVEWDFGDGGTSVFASTVRSSIARSLEKMSSIRDTGWNPQIRVARFIR
jgi:2EXR family